MFDSKNFFSADVSYKIQVSKPCCPSLSSQSTCAHAVSLFYCFLVILPHFFIFLFYYFFIFVSITIIIKFRIRNDNSIASGKNYISCRFFVFVFFFFLLSRFVLFSCFSFFSFLFCFYPIRIIITKNCEDVCCRRRYFVKKSTTHAGNVNSFAAQHHYRRPCELKNFNAATTNENDIRIKSMALIYSSSSHLKQPICIGTLIHPKVVMTTLVCASM